MQHVSTILWRRVDRPGHEFARLFCLPEARRIEGSAVFAHEGRLGRIDACGLEYAIVADDEWRTRRVSVRGWVGDERFEKEITVGVDGRWMLDGIEQPPVRGCLDIDLAFSPSTNLLPIRRLNLEVGGGVPVRAAWLRFPELTLEPLDQVYRRLDASTVRYESAGGRFVRELRVNADGMVTLYPDFWEAEAGG